MSGFAEFLLLANFIFKLGDDEKNLWNKKIVVSLQENNIVRLEIKYLIFNDECSYTNTFDTIEGL